MADSPDAAVARHFDPVASRRRDVPLDLQEVLNTAYDRAAYDMAIDYRREPVPPLDEAQHGARTLLESRGSDG